MEPVQVAQTIPPKSVSYEKADEKKMIQWHGRIISIREDISFLNRKITEVQKHIDQMSSKLSSTDIDDDAAEKYLEKKVAFIDQKTKLEQKISGLRAEKKELASQLDSEKEKKCKEIEEDLPELEKALAAEKEKLVENENILKGFETEAVKSEDSKVLREIRGKIKKQKETVQANQKEILEIERRQHKLFLASYAFGKDLKAVLYNDRLKGLKGKKIKIYFKNEEINSNDIHSFRCFVESQKPMIYIPVVKKLLKSEKQIETLDAPSKRVKTLYIYRNSYYTKLLAVPGESFQNYSNLKISVCYKELNIQPEYIYTCWDYSSISAPED